MDFGGVTGRTPLHGLRAGAAALALVAALALGGCDSQPDPSATTPVSGGSRRLVGPQADMVAAFSANRAQQGLVDLKFQLTKRPVVGEPVDIELALTPAVELERLFARFQVAEGLQLVSGGETDHMEHPAAGVPVGHKITVVAKSDGIFYITAIVLADSEKESVARTFSIPIIAGQGLVELPAAPPAANVADSKRTTATP
jgi:hypothetical protein